MLKLPVKDMIEGRMNNYPLVVAVAKRAREITDEIIETGSIVTEKPVKIAYEEISDGEYEVFDPEA